ncbi:MAG: rRNA maturation RNase YbeY [Bacteroidales bacterium]|nr:rRNA maturation RNase YbeY [Bacteroidales bacterium]
MINYFFEDTNFKFNKRRATSKWLKSAIALENKKLGDISIIYCSDDYLLEINKQYLSHDYYTDVITFNYCEGDLISGDIFISVDTIKANAEEYGASFDNELCRVMVHGILHLIGYDDDCESNQLIMRQKEDFYLERYDK